MGNKSSTSRGSASAATTTSAPAPAPETPVGGNSIMQGFGTLIQQEVKATGVERFENKNNDKVMPDIQPTIKDYSFAYDGGEGLWCEWWTLYFYGGEDEVDGLINYIFFRAANAVGQALIYPAVVLPNQKLSHIESDTYPLSEWKASANETDVYITETNRFYATDKEHNSFRVVGQSKDKELVWDMKIDRDPVIPPLIVSKNLPLANNQNITFISPVPCGPCTGTIELLGKKYEIDGLGEIEHIYGPLLLPVINWNLTHGYNPKETTSVYYLHVPFEKEGKDNSCGCLRFQHKTTTYLWKANDYTITETYAKNAVYPVKTIVQTKKDKQGYSCRATWKTSSISASNASDASENHVFVKIRLAHTETGNATIYRLEGMAEHHRFGLQKLVSKVKETIGLQ